MKENFDKYIPELLKHEGGFVNRSLKDDPGGATNMGITQKTLSEFRNKKATVADVKALTKKEAIEIYDKMYWDTFKGDQIHAGLDVSVFDFAVNSGPGRAAKYLQVLIGVKADGLIGPITVKAINAFVSANGIEATITNYNNLRIRYLKGLSNFKANPGWLPRVEAVKQASLELSK